MKHWAALLSISLPCCLLAAGCNGTPAPPPASGGETLVDAGQTGPLAPTAELEPRATDLLPVRRDRVLWYRAVFGAMGDGIEKEIAFFRVDDPDAGPYLESLGLGWGGRGTFKLLVRGLEVWVIPSGATAYRIYSEDEDVPGPYEKIQTPGGVFRAVKLQHTSGSMRINHWFAPGSGLVRFQLVVDGHPVVTLELIEVGPQGRPTRGYTNTTPEALWNSFDLAVRRLDVASLDGLLTPGMQARIRRPGWDKPSQRQPRAGATPTPTRRESRDDLVERIRLGIPDLLDVRLTPTGPWIVSKPGEGEGQVEATAKARLVAWLDGSVKESDVEIVLERGEKGWRWADFRPED